MPSLPAFNEAGDLPEGIFTATLDEALHRFDIPPAQRQRVAQRLRLIYSLAVSTGHLHRLIVYGSFVTAKSEPNDVDVFLLMRDGFEVSQIIGEASHVFDHMTAHNRLGASVFWVPQAACAGDEHSMISHWMLKRDGNRRGIVEIVAP